jgi:hypothetical protein
MFVGDAHTGNLLPGNMTWLSGMAGASDEIVTDPTPTSDPVFARMRTLAHMMGPIQQRVNYALTNMSNADVVLDMNSFAADVANLHGMHVEFANLVAVRNATNPYAKDLALGHDYLAFLAEWARGILDGVAGLPNVTVSYLGDIAEHGGKVAIGAIMPWAVLGVGVLVFLNYAEKSRTYRKVVA